MPLTNAELTELLRSGRLPQLGEHTALEIFAKLMEGSNPYGTYSMVDRVANVWVRTYSVIGLDRFRARLDRTVERPPGFIGPLEPLVPTSLREGLKYLFEMQTSLLFQHFWTLTAFSSIGWAANRPGMYSGFAGENDYLTDLGILATTRASINAVLEGALLLADGLRYREIMSPKALPEFAAGVAKQKEALNLADDGLSITRNEVDQHYWVNGNYPGRPWQQGRRPTVLNPDVPEHVRQNFQAAEEHATKFRAEVKSYLKEAEEIHLAVEKHIEKTKMNRSFLSVATFTGFVLNGMLATAMASMMIDHALGDHPEYKGEHGDNKRAVDQAVGSLLLISAVASIFTNGPKAIAALGAGLKSQNMLRDQDKEKGLLSKYKLTQGLVKEKYEGLNKVNKGFAIAGTAFGVPNALFSLLAISPNLGNDAYSSQEKGIVAAEMLTQATAMTVMVGSNIWLAHVIGNGLELTSPLTSAKGKAIVSGLKFLGPLAGGAVAGMMTAFSPLEIYGLTQQSKYADQVEKLGKSMLSAGYQGTAMLADLYRDKTSTEWGFFAGTQALSIVGTLAFYAALATPMASGAVLVDFVAGIVSGVLQGIKQTALEAIARDYIDQIKRKGGSLKFFGEDLKASANQVFHNSDMFGKLQTAFNVDQVVAVSSPKLTSASLQLAAITKNGADLKTVDSFIRSFVEGTADWGEKLTFNPERGELTLSATRESQVLTFLNPLPASGTEERWRVRTGKKAYTSTLRMAFNTSSDPNKKDVALWTITDGNASSSASSTMDLRNVVTQATNFDKTKTTSVLLDVNGYGGDDTVIAGAARLNFDGGDGIDSVSYAGLTGVSIKVQTTSTGYSVTKTLAQTKAYQEEVGESTVVYGKRTEKVQFRDFKLDTLSNPTIIDTLKNVEYVTRRANHVAAGVPGGTRPRDRGQLALIRWLGRGACAAAFFLLACFFYFFIASLPMASFAMASFCVPSLAIASFFILSFLAMAILSPSCFMPSFAMASFFAIASFAMASFFMPSLAMASLLLIASLPMASFFMASCARALPPAASRQAERMAAVKVWVFMMVLSLMKECWKSC